MPDPPPHASADVLRRLALHATSIATRQGQKLALGSSHGPSAFLVRKGTFVTYVTLPDARRRIMSVFYPGDIIGAPLVPPLVRAVLCAATASGEVWRLPWSRLEQLAATDTGFARLLTANLIDQAARQAIHALRIGALSGTERVASFLIELALRTGTPLDRGLAFELPLARAGLADYLALNPDTVSRIVSRLKTRGLLSQSGRRHIHCRDLDALGKECPLSSAIAELHLGARAPCPKGADQP
jgi:CRP-like cAMP-binding protein